MTRITDCYVHTIDLQNGIPIADILRCEADDTVSGAASSLVFVLHSRAKKYYFKARSKVDRDEWVKVISVLILMSNY